MIKYSTLCLLLTVIEISCRCPQLKPNHNVHVLCSIEDSSNKLPRKFKCSESSSTNTTGKEISVGTTAVYKCDKYFKPINRMHDGILNCTEDGTWANLKTFQEFYCEFDCGKQPVQKNELIIGGNATEANSWPWVATVFRRSKDGNFKYSCGGTLIGQKTILTAAHCVIGITKEGYNKLPADDFRIFLGTFNSSYKINLKEARVQMFSVKEIDVHPDFDVESFSADVAIIVLTDKVTFTETALPICFPSSHAHNSLAITKGNIGEISSFGIDGTGRPAEILQRARIPIQSIATCHDFINIIPLGDQFCGGNPNGPNICRGDSGSGLVFKSSEWNEEKYSIHGIVSNTGEVANGCAPMVVFTKIFSHISWIQDKYDVIENLSYLLKIKTTSTHSVQKQLMRSRSKLYTRSEIRALIKLRLLVKDILLEDYMHRDEYLIRFLRTKKLNINETKEMLQAAMNWRKANRMNEILKEDFTRFRRDYTIFDSGFDKDGRPVYLYLVGLWDLKALVDKGEEDNFIRYIIRSFEEKEEQVRSIGKPNITQWVVINDMYGINIQKQVCPGCLRIWREISKLEQYLPQMVYAAYMINCPKIIDRLMDAVRPFVSEQTVLVVRWFGTNKTEWSQDLLKQIPADQLYIAYGGTKTVKEGTKRIQLAL